MLMPLLYEQQIKYQQWKNRETNKSTYATKSGIVIAFVLVICSQVIWHNEYLNEPNARTHSLASTNDGVHFYDVLEIWTNFYRNICV